MTICLDGNSILVIRGDGMMMIILYTIMKSRMVDIDKSIKKRLVCWSGKLNGWCAGPGKLLLLRCTFQDVLLH